ncbi:MAG: sulfur-carrier protein adenylyltransferase/sulfurtransferase [Actinomycetota bacterium]|nr:sulfur-carrier protein adenylyltransferase/sulfurtransferase [Actinomycetota bacterium]
MTNFREVFRRVKEQTPEVAPEEIRARIEAGEQIRLVDVREPEEVATGVVPGAAQLSRAHFESRIEDIVPDKSRPVVVYCATGVRSIFAARQMAELGYENVASMNGGFSRWKDLGYDFQIPNVLDKDQRDRYARHLILSDVGEEGQLKLLDAKVLSIGAGGLGSPALLYLAAAGVGTIGIVDSDRVEASNLQRQVIHDTQRIGVLKAESARETLTKLNPDVTVNVHNVRMDASNVRELISGYDIIVDGSDNFDTRYVLNDAAVELRKPVVHGSIFRFEGMVSTFVPFDGPCYRCLYPEAPPPDLAPNCSEAGVLGVLPGIVGCLQANDALKLIIGYGEPLMGRLLVFDAQATTFSEVKVRRDPRCPTCGEKATAAEDAPAERMPQPVA